MEEVSNINSIDAYNRLKDQADAALIDVRTTAEFNSVGVPDMSNAKAKLLLLPIYDSPHMELNPNFDTEVDEFAKSNDVKVLYFICRSGARSQIAAELLSKKGYTTFNVVDGFEGKIDEKSNSRTINGWKAGKLPWRWE